MNWEVQHNHVGDLPALVDVVLFPRSGQIYPVNIVIIVDCSASMRGHLMAADEFVRMMYRRNDSVHVVCAGDTVQICSPADCAIGANFNIAAAIRAAAGLRAAHSCNHVIIITDDPDQITPQHCDAVWSRAYLHIISANTFSRSGVSGTVAEIAEYIATAAGKYTAMIMAPDGVRITYMPGDVQEIRPLKYYSIAFSAKVGAPSVYFRVSLREQSPVSVKIFRDGELEDTILVEFDVADHESNLDILPIALVHDLSNRALAADDATAADLSASLNAIETMYVVTPEIAGAIAECRGILGRPRLHI